MKRTRQLAAKRKRGKVSIGAQAGLLIASAILAPSLAAFASQPGTKISPSVVKTVRNASDPDQGKKQLVHRLAGTGQSFTPAPELLPAHRMLDSQLEAIGNNFDGDVGIAVKDIQSGYTTHFDGARHFPQQSVSKFWVTLTALAKADRGELNINAPVTVRKSDLTLFNQPIAQLVGANGFTTTLTDLMQRAMQQSDNTANDFVLWRTGGPEAVREFLRLNGISGIRFGPGERVMQSRIAGMEWKPSYVGKAFYAARNAVPLSVRRSAFESYVSDPVDGATPLGVVDALARLKKGELLSPSSTDRLLRIMSNTRTGPQRLKGGLAPGWKLAHKTGTGQVLGSTHSGYNDIGIITSPEGRSYAIAVFIRRTTTPIPQRMAMMQSVTRAVINYDRTVSAYSFARRNGTVVATN